MKMRIFDLKRKMNIMAIGMIVICLCQGCIYDNRDHCPSDRTLIINLTHLYNSEYIDKLEEVINKIDIFKIGRAHV